MQNLSKIYQYFFPPEPAVDYKNIPEYIKDYKNIPEYIKDYINNYCHGGLTNEEKRTAVNEYIKRVDIKFFEAIKDIKEDNELNKKLYKDAKAEARQRSIEYNEANSEKIPPSIEFKSKFHHSQLELGAVAVPSSARSRNDSLVSFNLNSSAPLSDTFALSSATTQRNAAGAVRSSIVKHAFPR